jgi:IS30 family transposase
MQVSHETIYQALYVQGRGELRRELAKCLRTGRARRKPQRSPDQRISRFNDPMIMISQRPAEVANRAVPGHWEGDLIIGKEHKSAIGTLVERSTRFLMLVHLPNGHDAEQVAAELVAMMNTLPKVLKGSLTWDQGSEMASHKRFSMATQMPVYFCDPASPWQRGSNENTNGLLRQYFPKGTDLKQHSVAKLIEVADELNARPRKTLGWLTPTERLTMLLHESITTSVATTP